VGVSRDQRWQLIVHTMRGGQVMTNVFLSHKKDFAAQAQVLALALRKITPGVAIFRSEDIEKGRDWRDAVNRALEEAKCFILLYMDPTLDWSWCFYEAGAFVSNGRKPRPVFCLHPKTVDPPSPLANLQAIRAEQADIEKWIRNGLCHVLKCRPKQTEDKLKTTAKDIAKLVNATAPLQEAILKPYILIEPKWSGDWTATDKIPEIDFADASVSIDRDSARELGFSGLPNLTLLPFLRRIACDSSEVPGKVEFWIKKFFESLQKAAEGSLNFQEAAYFRHENGKIYRPVVVSYSKNAGGTRCRLRVIFATAFGTPLTDSPGLTQRLSIGARLAVRTRLEVLDPFLGHTSQVHRDKVLSTRPENEVSRKNPVGGRLVEALDAIWQEALSHGMRPDEPAPKLFEGPAQQVYEDLRNRGVWVWDQIKLVAPREDRKANGNYPETERLLAELDQINEDYLALVLPRIEELLVPAEKRHVKIIAVSPGIHAVRQDEAGFGDHSHHGIH
jgi:TIR domain